jgi:hypothetical protein
LLLLVALRPARDLGFRARGLVSDQSNGMPMPVAAGPGPGRPRALGAAPIDGRDGQIDSRDRPS